MHNIKKMLWFSLGMICLGISYIGVVTPGIPWSTPAVGAAFCFAKSNKAWHDWLMNHRLFGAFLRDWTEHRVFPRKGKWMMFITMDISLIIMWTTTHNVWLVMGVALIMALVCAWAFRLPETRSQAEQKLNHTDN